MLILILTLITLLLLFYFYRQWKFSYFTKQGIYGPKPNILFGNLLDLRKGRFDQILVDWQSQFGKTYVYFEGSTPNFVIGDPDLLQEVMIKQFSNFHGRKLFPMQKNPDIEPKVSMFIARGKRWKRMRTTINPAFTENKMRKMYPLIAESLQSFMDSVGKEMEGKGKAHLEIQDRLQRLTMDIICKCAFGIETNSQTNKNHPFIQSLKRFLSTQSFSTGKAALVMTLPEIRFFWIKLFEFMNLRPADSKDIKYIRSQMSEVISQRRNSKEKHYDLLQLLLDAEVSGTGLLDEENLCPINNNITATLSDEGDQISDEESKKPPGSGKGSASSKPLTSDEIMSQAQLFLFAGYETSSTAMSFTLHLLAGHPGAQEKLCSEIDKAFKTSKSTTYDSMELYDIVSKLPYLNAVIYEVLRIRPFANTVVSRMCLKSGGTQLSNGVYLPENTNIIPNGFAIHRDPDIWIGTDPEKFEPERFLSKLDSEDDSAEVKYEFIGPPHPMAWLPFGAGPRNCIGQRFAMMVIKSSLARFLHNYKVAYANESQRHLELRVGATISPITPISLDIIRR